MDEKSSPSVVIRKPQNGSSGIKGLRMIDVLKIQNDL
jgi:hypothetical protein